MLRASIYRVLVLTLTVLLFPTLALAEDDWRVRFGGVWLDPDVSFDDIDSDGDRVQAGADSEIGFHLALERRVTPRVGIEVGALIAEPDLTLDANLANGLSFSTADGLSTTLLTAALNFHLTPNKAVDVYIGPLLAYASFGNVAFNVDVAGETMAARFSTDDEAGFGGQLGADIAIGDGGWAVNLAARYYDIGLSVTDEDGEETDLGFEPFSLSAGLTYRF